MIRILIIAGEREQASRLSSGLVDNGLTCTVVPDLDKAAEKLSERAPDLVLVAAPSSPSSLEISHMTRKIGEDWHLPVVALLPRDALGILDSNLAVDDFVVEPWDPAEVALRVKRVLSKTSELREGEVIRYGDLQIDIARCEVFVKGELVPLTFKEYELLRLLASQNTKVFTRQALLNKIWGYDYYGGDRTVDVHVRRLRSKIEDQDSSFIETVRNVGYKFKVSG